MTTKVANIRGVDPDVWRRDPKNIYVGRDARLRSGRFEGSSWHNSGFGNPFRFGEGDTDADKKMRLFAYSRFLFNKLDTQPLIRSQFRLMRGATLGCWCVNWDGLGNPPLCHAAWLARIVDLLDSNTAVSVSDTGLIQRAEYHSMSNDHTVVFWSRKL